MFIVGQHVQSQVKNKLVNKPRVIQDEQFFYQKVLLLGINRLS